MAEILSNKFEKEKRVIELHSVEGKTIRDIAKEVHMSFRDISKIIKEYSRKQIKRENIKNNNNNATSTKKQLRCNKAYALFLNGKTPVQASIDLQIDYEEVRRYWTEYLRLQNMKDLYNIYIDNEFHLDYLLHIYFFMLRNKIPKKACETVLLNAYTVINLNNSISNLKSEWETWQGLKNNHDNAPLEPLPKINWNYPNYHF
jgi:transposase